MKLLEQIKYLLLQVRDLVDPMRSQEVDCFASALHCPRENIQVHDLISGRPSHAAIAAVDVIIIGGSGDYSVAVGGPWLDDALETMRELHDRSKPTFASCWGFQAFAKALGGVVVTDLDRAEIGTIEFRLTAAGLDDPVFGPLGPTFLGQIGHQDIVERLPPDAVSLAYTDKVQNEAFVFIDKPIYGTQFHPELTLERLIERLIAYPSYIKNITGLDFDDFVHQCRPSPGTSQLLPRFVQHLICQQV